MRIRVIFVMVFVYFSSSTAICQETNKKSDTISVERACALQVIKAIDSAFISKGYLIPGVNRPNIYFSVNVDSLGRAESIHVQKIMNMDIDEGLLMELLYSINYDCIHSLYLREYVPPKAYRFYYYKGRVGDLEGW